MPDKFIIKGGFPLQGEVEISGSKNAAGPILAATLLTKKTCLISNLPQISDISDMVEIIRIMGAKVVWINRKTVKIAAENISPEKIPANIFEKVRMSVLLIGPLLARFSSFKIPHPGGDKIGLRPITTHLEALAGFDAKVTDNGQYYCFKRQTSLRGAEIVLKEFSVTATESAMMAATLARGESKIEIAAAEPHVKQLGNFLVAMGAKITGQGTHEIIINGVKNIDGANIKIAPDYIEAGTLFIALAITGGEGKIKNVEPDDLIFFLDKMKELGVSFKIQGKNIIIKKSLSPGGQEKFKAAKVQILPHPGFPADLQPQTCVLLTQAKGKSLIHDPLYENRFAHLHELRKMGADIEITDPHRALIFGPAKLIGTKVDSNDIRAGAALVLAGLIAKGTTIIDNIQQIDRGYDKIEEKLRSLGAKIERVKE